MDFRRDLCLFGPQIRVLRVKLIGKRLVQGIAISTLFLPNKIRNEYQEITYQKYH